jgi:hypothetical protein
MFRTCTFDESMTIRSGKLTKHADVRLLAVLVGRVNCDVSYTVSRHWMRVSMRVGGQWWAVLFVCTTAEFDTIEKKARAAIAEEAGSA